MLDFPIWKRLFLWALTIVTCLLALPSVFSAANLAWPAQLIDPKVNLGLDLAGGSHILLEASADQIKRQRLETMAEDVRNRLRQAKIETGDISTKDGTVAFMVSDPAKAGQAREALQTLTSGASLSGQRDWDLNVDGGRIVLVPTAAGIAQAQGMAMDSATDVVRKRIDSLGTREPTIIRSGESRIVVQVPGLSDPAELKALLGQTAKLEFRLVDLSADPTRVAQGIAPPGSELLPFANPETDGTGRMAVKRYGGIKGDSLTNAVASFDDRTNEPIVQITFDQTGGKKFADLTRNNVGKPFAIILDGKVLSAPKIQEPILGGQASISGSFTSASANQLAISLVSGALPVDLKVVEERSVGPDLGADSIAKGGIALGVGTVLLIVFMFMTYGRFGFYANSALILNAVMILGIMALIGGTLTLPGIAGFVLTMGAAVDANVLINERIREERARGRKVHQAVELGYKEASRAIFDANITNIIAAVLMFIIGSGPVRGFAVVLIIGIGTSVFTAVWMTRMWVAGWLHRTRPSDIVL